jgi:hypothetical protein
VRRFRDAMAVSRSVAQCSGMRRVEGHAFCGVLRARDSEDEVLRRHRHRCHASDAFALPLATQGPATEPALERAFGRTRGDAVDLWPPPRLRRMHLRRPQGPQR